MAREHGEGGFGDWYLPSPWELNLLYMHKNAVGGLTNANYWSSLEHSQDTSWYQISRMSVRISKIKAFRDVCGQSGLVNI